VAFSGAVTPSAVGGFSHLAAVARAAVTAAEEPPDDAGPLEAVADDELPELEHALRITISSAQNRPVNTVGRAITPVRTGRVIVVPACG
jgi:hypothetical protein